MEYYKIEELSGVTYFKDKDLKKIQLSILKYLGEKYLKEEKSQTCQVSGLCDDAFCLIRHSKLCGGNKETQLKRNQEALRLFKQLSEPQMEFNFE